MKFPEMQHSQLFQIPVSSFFSYYLLLLASSAVLQEESIEVGGQSWKYMQGKERKRESTEGIEKNPTRNGEFVIPTFNMLETQGEKALVVTPFSDFA